MKTECQFCGIAFQAVRSTAMYCSGNCRTRAWLAKNPQPERVRGKCVVCGAVLSGKQRKHCSAKCAAKAHYRYDPNYRSPARLRRCSRCGAEIVITTTSAVNAMCRPCRMTAFAEAKRQQCSHCGRSFERATPGKYCSRACAAKSRAEVTRGKPGRRTRPDEDPRVRRRDRERAAPGLSHNDRAQLLTRWRAQGRLCIYCMVERVETIDHVIALVRGGTNFEGNLAPACRACNGRKRDRTVAEYRYSKNVGPCMTVEWDVHLASADAA